MLNMTPPSIRPHTVSMSSETSEKYRDGRRNAMGSSSKIRDVLDEYEPRDASEVADVARLRALLERADVCDRSAPVHVTGSALVVHPPSHTVLLRWHPRMQ